MGTYRLDFAFEGGELQVTGVAESAHKTSGEDAITKDASGFWLTVHDSDGAQVSAQILRDPRTGEGGDGVIADQAFSAFVEDPGKNGFVAFHIAFPKPGDTDFTGERTFRFPLSGDGAGLNVFSKLLKTFETPNLPVWLLILSDGFAPEEESKFLGFAKEVVERLFHLEPFSKIEALRERILVQIGPGKPGGAFGWTRDGLEGRLLMKVDHKAVGAYISDELKIDPVNVLVVINDERYGGSGGDPAVTGLGSPAIQFDRHNAINAAIHELAHSAFALADEYDTVVKDANTKPVELNVAHDEASVRAKWGELLTPGPLQTDAKTAAKDAVGMFRGAKYDPEKNYRSQVSCRMRSVEQDFCAACQKVIRDVLACEL